MGGMLLRRLAVCAAVSVGLVVPAVVPSAVSSASAGPTTRYQYGTVTAISDGDTIYVDIAGDGKAVGVPIRNADLQATEMHGAGGRPECGAQAARNLMARLTPVRSRVRLASWYNTTSGKDPKGATRLERYVDAYNPATGKYDIDVQRRIIDAGLGIWGNSAEDARVTSYHKATAAAMARRVGLFKPSFCGAGPAASVVSWIHYDADNEGTVENAEYIRFQNTSAKNLSIAGWRLRDSTHSIYKGGMYYRFPAGSVIPAKGVVTVYPGRGTDDPARGRFFLQYTRKPVYPNVANTAVGYPGHTTYLQDPRYNIRAAADYPCLSGCRAPAVRISAVQYRGADEYVDITNPGATAAVNLSGVEVTNDGWSKEIRPGTVLGPGQTLRVHGNGHGSDTALVQYWNRGASGGMFEDSGDTVQLRTAGSKVFSSYRWGVG
jgi:endonuclease YncB( thermonuclease family)